MLSNQRFLTRSFIFFINNKIAISDKTDSNSRGKTQIWYKQASASVVLREVELYGDWYEVSKKPPPIKIKVQATINFVVYDHHPHPGGGYTTGNATSMPTIFVIVACSL